jgi:hypothetical protein
VATPGSDFLAAVPNLHLEGANLYRTHLERARLREVHLEGASLYRTHLEGAYLYRAHLQGADLRLAIFDAMTVLNDIVVADGQYGPMRLADVRWQGVNLAVVKGWPANPRLGDELKAEKRARTPMAKAKAGTTREQRRKDGQDRRETILDAYQTAARAYRQLATVMRDQGMNDEADRFAYRGQLMQRKVYRYQRKRFRAAFSWFLDLIAGYGYKPERSLLAYVGVILGFAAAYFIIGQTAGPPLSPFGAFVFSMTSFHGRGFFPGGIGLDDPLTGTAAFEALFGLIIEITFIATFTQRWPLLGRWPAARATGSAPRRPARLGGGPTASVARAGTAAAPSAWTLDRLAVSPAAEQRRR